MSEHFFMYQPHPVTRPNETELYSGLRWICKDMQVNGIGDNRRLIDVKSATIDNNRV